MHNTPNGRRERGKPGDVFFVGVVKVKTGEIIQ